MMNPVRSLGSLEVILFSEYIALVERLQELNNKSEAQASYF